MQQEGNGLGKWLTEGFRMCRRRFLLKKISRLNTKQYLESPFSIKHHAL